MITTYEIKILTSDGQKTVYYHNNEPLEDFEKRITERYGKFFQLDCKEVNLSNNN